jgi:hypothetical protein
MKSLKQTLFLTVAVALTTAVNATAGGDAVSAPVNFNSATPAQLSGKAAELVAQADAKSQRQTTIDVVKAAVKLNPAGAAEIVGSIAKASPESAATAAGTAVTLVPNRAVSIARAAALAAPAKAGAIVEAICRVVPADYAKVAVAEVVPGATREILAGVSAALPQLASAINQTLAASLGVDPSVNLVLAQSGGAAVPLAQGPTITAPLVPITLTPTIINPANGTQVPSGAHNYSAP